MTFEGDTHKIVFKVWVEQVSQYLRADLWLALALSHIISSSLVSWWSKTEAIYTRLTAIIAKIAWLHSQLKVLGTQKPNLWHTVTIKARYLEMKKWS